MKPAVIVPVVIVHWQDPTTHLRRYRDSSGHAITYCGESFRYALYYLAPKGTMVLCMGCIAAEGL